MSENKDKFWSAAPRAHHVTFQLLIVFDPNNQTRTSVLPICCVQKTATVSFVSQGFAILLKYELKKSCKYMLFLFVKLLKTINCCCWLFSVWLVSSVLGDHQPDLSHFPLETRAVRRSAPRGYTPPTTCPLPFHREPWERDKIFFRWRTSMIVGDDLVS